MEKNKYIKSYNNFMNESKQESFGCLMAYVNIDNWQQYTKFINKNDLVSDDVTFINTALEDEPHVTILFGFILESTNKDDVLKDVKNIFKEPFDITVKNISIFENDEYDVLKFDIKSEILTEANSFFIKNYDYQNDYPKYNPHMTLAYLKSGMGKKYIEKIKNSIDFPFTFNVDKIIYSENAEKKAFIYKLK